MKYTDLIFDLYGTLVDIHTDENDEVWEKTALYFGFHGASYSGKQLKEAFSALITEREAKAGQSYECFPDIPLEQVMQELFEAQGITENASVSVIVGDFQRIELYAQLGYQLPQYIPPEAWEAYHALVAMGFDKQLAK